MLDYKNVERRRRKKKEEEKRVPSLIPLCIRRHLPSYNLATCDLSVVKSSTGSKATGGYRLEC